MSNSFTRAVKQKRHCYILPQSQSVHRVIIPDIKEEM